MDLKAFKFRLNQLYTKNEILLYIVLRASENLTFKEKIHFTRFIPLINFNKNIFTEINNSIKLICDHKIDLLCINYEYCSRQILDLINTSKSLIDIMLEEYNFGIYETFSYRDEDILKALHSIRCNLMLMNKEYKSNFIDLEK